MTICASGSSQSVPFYRTILQRVEVGTPCALIRRLCKVSATTTQPTAASGESAKPRSCGLVRRLRHVFSCWFAGGRRARGSPSASQSNSTHPPVPSMAQRREINNLACEIEVLTNLQTLANPDGKKSALLSASNQAYQRRINLITNGLFPATTMDGVRDDVALARANQVRQEVCQELILERQTLNADNLTCLDFFIEQFKRRFCAAQALLDRSLAVTGYQPGKEPELDVVLQQYRDNMRQLNQHLAAQKISENAKQRYQEIKPLLIEYLLPAINKISQGKSAADQHAMAEQIKNSFLGHFIEMKFYDKYLLEIKPIIQFERLDLDKFKQQVELFLLEQNASNPSLLGQAVQICAPGLRAVVNPDSDKKDLQAQANDLLCILRDFPKVPIQPILNAGARRKVLAVLSELIEHKQKKTNTDGWLAELKYRVTVPLNGDRRKMEMDKQYLAGLQQLDVTSAQFEAQFGALWDQFCKHYYDLGLINVGASLQRLGDESLSKYSTAFYAEIKDPSHLTVAKQRLIPIINRWLQKPKQNLAECEAVIAASPLHDYLQVNRVKRTCLLRPVPRGGKHNANQAALIQAMEKVNYHQYSQDWLAKEFCHVVAEALIEMPPVRPVQRNRLGSPVVSNL